MESELSLLKATVGELAESPILKEFASVWQEMGLTDELRKTRRETIQLHLTNLLREIVDEEINLKQKLVDSVGMNERELEGLARELSLSVELPSAKLSLHEREKQLRDQVNTLNKTKFDRKKRLKRLAEMEVGLCKMLGETAQLGGAITSKVVPSEEQLDQWRKRINELEKTRAERLDWLVDIQEKASKIWAELECEPTGELAAVHSSTAIKTYIFSAENMTKLEESYKELEDQVVELHAKAIKLRETITSLWDRLDITQEERDSFNEDTHGYTTKTIAKLEAETERLNELKKENMAKFVQATRDELNKIWDSCFYGEQQRREFAPAFSDDYTDDLLNAHESELDRMRGFYKDNEDVYKLVQKRENLWKKFLELEEKDSDPNRLFNTRGGQLLKDQKLRQQLKKDLPKVEKELKSVLEQWEEDHERYFAISDSRYLDTIARQWAERDEQKEKEKVKRHKVKEETTLIEMVYGSKPTTPKKILKRTAASPLAATAPINKIRKVSQSPLVHSSSSASRPPRSIRTRTTKTPIRPPQKRLGRTNSRKILAERNTSVSITPTSSALTVDESLISHANVSMASACSSYTDFQRDLLHSAKTSRSSAIPRSSSMDNVV